MCPPQVTSKLEFVVAKMYSTHYLKVLKRHLDVCKFLKCIPFEFDETLGRIIKTRSLKHIRIFRLECILSLIYTVAVFLNISVGHLTLTGKCKGLAFFPLYIFGVVTRWNYSLDLGSMQVINSMLEFEMKVLSGEKSKFREKWGYSLWIRIINFETQIVNERVTLERRKFANEF